MKTSNKIIPWLALATLTISAMGCTSDDNRTVTKEESAAADVKRQAAIDDLNIPESQKAAMKAHLGGAPVANPADQARAAAGESGRRR